MVGGEAMTWATLDDHITEHPKIVKAGHLAELVQYRAIIYANRNLTNGLVPAAIVPSLCRGFEDRAGEVIAVLVLERLWQRQPDGDYLIHDFLADGHNLSKAEVESRRVNRQKSGSKGGKAKAARRRQGQANG